MVWGAVICQVVYSAQHSAAHSSADTMVKGMAAMLGLVPKGFTLFSEPFVWPSLQFVESGYLYKCSVLPLCQGEMTECHRNLWEGENHRRGHLGIIMAMSGKRWLQNLSKYPKSSLSVQRYPSSNGRTSWSSSSITSFDALGQQDPRSWLLHPAIVH